jgi:hypothetical protein
MTRNATFEFTTNLNPKIVLEQISKLWLGLGYEVDIYTLETFVCNIEDKITLFCTLDYIYGASEEEEMIRKVVAYLLNISLEQKIYYYRYMEARSTDDLDERKKTPIEITVDDLFREEYEPSLSGIIDLRYVIRLK